MTARRGDAHAMKMRLTTLALCGALAFGVAACGDDEEEPAGSSGGQTQAETGGSEPSAEVDPNLSGTIRIDGSSTVQPFAEAAAELFGEQAPNVKISVGGAGTGDGFERFCRGEIDISNASRAIEEEEVAACKKGKVQYSEVQVANDALAVVTNPDLEFPDNCIKTSNLKKLLRPNAKISNYSELGEGYPDAKATFFTPGEESGTFDYFTEAVLETDAEQRRLKDVQTVGQRLAARHRCHGHRGRARLLRLLVRQREQGAAEHPVDRRGDGCVAPSLETRRAASTSRCRVRCSCTPTRRS
jgi:phosphate transport system substrate-binding protein